eukprot:TRINITY_DN15659_c0_g2_i2.p1 TRINITY_DN15659_c0_g2~~TRINITY_DN15659_c0_g2_i2.p1  ORF type:complete len:488 (+),score=162.70 TRINITY_DN15659_c0_g2_i2:63-1526(+)
MTEKWSATTDSWVFDRAWNETDKPGPGTLGLRSRPHLVKATDEKMDYTSSGHAYGSDFRPTKRPTGRARVASYTKDHDVFAEDTTTPTDSVTKNSGRNPIFGDEAEEESIQKKRHVGVEKKLKLEDLPEEDKKGKKVHGIGKLARHDSIRLMSHPEVVTEEEEEEKRTIEKDHVINKLVRQVLSSWTKLRLSIDNLLESGGHKVMCRKLTNAFEDVGASLTEEEWELVLGTNDPEGMVSITPFLTAINVEANRIRASVQDASEIIEPEAPPEKSKKDTIRDLLKDKVFAKLRKIDHKIITATLRKCDATGFGRLTESDYKRALDLLLIEVLPPEMEVLWEDAPKLNGYMDMEKFLLQIRFINPNAGPEDPVYKFVPPRLVRGYSRLEVNKKVQTELTQKQKSRVAALSRIRDSIAESMFRIANTCRRRFDIANEEVVDYRQYRHALEDSSIVLSEEDFFRLCLVASTDVKLEKELPLEVRGKKTLCG